ncbi:MAG: zinc ribbon domain-containing protein [Planctomycetes bacterium]|nr:zinc ribbon domain-containing protein [Planctomycetota bacterium]
MPTYDYRCNGCGHAFEHFQSMSDPHLKKCPSCGKAKLERLIGAGAGLIFKGSGFYITDYRSDSYHEAAKKDGSSSAAADAKPAAPAGGASTPATPAAKGDAKPATATPTAPTAPTAPSKPAAASSSSRTASRSSKGGKGS